MAFTNLLGQVRVGVRQVVTAQQLQTATYLFDSYGGAAVAYSLRKLKSDYTGSAIRVRRSSDNTEQNIGFDASGNLDLTSLSTFTNPTDNGKLLDSYSGASVAYSLRKLSATWSGSAIRVRRSSDNAEQNIGFDTGGNLDTTSLLSFVGSGNGFVKTWYDQSGNSNNAFQMSAANQPQIVSNGSLILRNSKPYIEATSSRYFQFTTELHNASGSEYSLWMTYEKDAGGSQAVLLKDGFNYMWLDYGTSQAVSPTSTFNISAHATNTLYMINILALNAGAGMWRNSLSIGSGGAPGVARATHLPASSYRTAKITMSEFIYYPTNKTSQRVGISANINGYYSIHSPNGSAFVTTWYDQSGNGRNATQTSASSQPSILSSGTINIAGGKPSIYFNGSNSILCPHNSGTTNEMYFVTQTTDTMYLYPSNLNSSFNYGFVSYQNNSSNGLYSTYGSPQLYSNGFLKTLTTRNDIYNSLNGYKLSAHKGSNLSAWVGNPMVFGTYHGGGYEYTGDLQEWLIYPTLQGSQSSIESNINSYYSLWDSSIVSSGLVLNLDASFKSSYPGTGTAWYDISGRGNNNGTLTNGPLFGTTNGGQMTFDGINDYITIPDDSSNRFGNQFSMSLSFYWDGVARTNNTLFAKRNTDPYNSFSFGINNGDPYSGGTGRTLMFFARPDQGGGSALFPNVGTLDSLLLYDLGTTPKNVHATVTIDSNSQKLYINGNLVSSISINLISRTFNVTGRPVVLGATRDNGSGYFNYANTRIYSAQLYNRTLTSIEVTQNFNSTKTRLGL